MLPRRAPKTPFVPFGTTHPIFCADWGFVFEDSHPSLEVPTTFIFELTPCAFRHKFEVLHLKPGSSPAFTDASSDSTRYITNCLHNVGHCTNNQLTSAPFHRFPRDYLVFGLLDRPHCHNGIATNALIGRASYDLHLHSFFFLEANASCSLLNAHRPKPTATFIPITPSVNSLPKTSF